MTNGLLAHPAPSVPEAAEVEAFLREFFAPPNRFAFDDLAHQRHAYVRPWVEDVRASPPQPAVLPCWRADQVVWYIVPFSPEQAGALADVLEAFVGSTFSTFRGVGEPLDSRDPIDSAVARVTRGLGSKLRGPTGRDGQRLLRQHLELMRGVLGQRPIREVDRPRATGRVLRDFFVALAAGNAASAEAHVQYLVEHRRIDAANGLFLRVQAHAAFKRWKTLLALPELGDLLEMRRPVAVTEALLQAVYWTELAPFAIGGDLDGMAAAFEASVRPKFGALLTRRAGIRAFEAATVLMLHATVGPLPDTLLRDTMVALPDLSEDARSLLQALAERRPAEAPPVDADVLRAASAAQQEGDYDRVFSLASQAPASLVRARLLLEAAYELQSLEARATALDAVAVLSPEERDSLLSTRLQRTLYERLRNTTLESIKATDDQTEERGSGVETVALGTHAAQVDAQRASVERVPNDWLEWLARVESDVSWSQALQVARQGGAEWEVEAFLSRPGAADILAAALNRATSSDALQCALPHLLAYLRRDPAWPRREAAPLYGLMMQVLVLGTRGAEDDLVVAYDLLDVLLGFAPDMRHYEALMNEVEYLVTEHPSLAQVSWGLDVLDLMLMHPCPARSLPLRMLTVVTAVLQKHWRHVDPSQWDTLGALASDIGYPEVVQGAAPPNALRGRTEAEGSVESVHAAGPSGVDFTYLYRKAIVLYSLTENATRRARDLILEREPGATVELCADHVGGPRLRHLARNADVFIVATGSAKHAATEFIEAHRPKGDPTRVTLRPAGRGTASILQALSAYLANHANTAT